jgi:hypothetical protein
LSFLPIFTAFTEFLNIFLQNLLLFIDVFTVFVAIKPHYQILPISQILPKDLNSGSVHFILLATYEWVQKTRVFQSTALERLAKDTHTSLLSPSLSNEDEMAQGLYSQYFILFVS